MRVTKWTAANVVLAAVALTGGGLAYATVGTPSTGSTKAVTRTATIASGDSSAILNDHGGRITQRRRKASRALGLSKRPVSASTTAPMVDDWICCPPWFPPQVS